MSKPFAISALAALLLIGAGVAGAQTEMTYIVHGIPGQDIGQSADLPVDVSVGGTCALEDFAFGQVVGPVPIDVPAADIKVYLADNDGDPGCDGTLVLDLPGVPFGGEVSAIVAQLTDDGNPGAGDALALGITAGKFDLDLSAPDRGKGRLIAHHTALAPSVDVDLFRGRRASRGITVGDFAPGEQEAADLRPGNWRVRLRVAGTSDVAFGPTKIRLQPYRALVVFAVGTALTPSFDLIGFQTPTAFR